MRDDKMSMSTILRNKARVDCNRDFSLNTVVGPLQPGMCERNIGKRIYGANVWSQLAALYQCTQLIKLSAVLSVKTK